MSNEDDNPQEIKMILIGDSGVGKTNLINTSIGLSFTTDENPTASGTFVSKEFEIDGKTYIINLWDTAGEESYRGITQLFYRGAEIVVLVYDICSLESFNSLKDWYELAENTINTEHIYGIAGNKKDLFLESKTDDNEAMKFAESKNAKFKLVSAKEDPGSFIQFVEELIMVYKKIPKLERRQSIKIDKKKKPNNNKENCNKC